jgi:hypothetical protein
MMGLGSTAKLTPLATGKFLVSLCGDMYHVTANMNVIASLYYGTGTPPANAAATVGSFSNAQVQKGGTWPAATRVPFALSAVITGLALGTQVWFDISLLTSGAAGGAIENVSVTVVEIP